MYDYVPFDTSLVFMALKVTGARTPACDLRRDLGSNLGRVISLSFSFPPSSKDNKPFDGQPGLYPFAVLTVVMALYSKFGRGIWR